MGRGMVGGRGEKGGGVRMVLRLGCFVSFMYVWKGGEGKGREWNIPGQASAVLITFIPLPSIVPCLGVGVEYPNALLPPLVLVRGRLWVIQRAVDKRLRGDLQWRGGIDQLQYVRCGLGW